MTDEEKFHAAEQAAELGHRDAQYQCGLMYDIDRMETGLDVSSRKKLALHWYEKAAEQGHPEAQNVCAYMYNMGSGTAKDEDKARYWYEKAAAQTEDMKVRNWAGGMLYLMSTTVTEEEKAEFLRKVEKGINEDLRKH